MASKKPQQSLGDYVTIALSPLLIMALVGSLVFFLLEILYVGQYSGRLQWTLFFFVFAVVLIARISIEMGSERAVLYALGIGGAVFLALQRFVEYPPGSFMASFGWAVNIGLMALAWWSAHKLTWDCTYIDDQVDASGKGVLEAAGLDQSADTSGDEADDSLAEPAHARKLPPLVAWMDRYRRYREAQRLKPHTPGVWVVYFSLAALPLYGLGQSFIPAAEAERRRYAFWLMVCYVGSGLCLLLTTSYLGLRRYLRQRKLKMPAAMTAVWLALGVGLVATFLVVGALLPRPYPEYQLVQFKPLGSKDQQASRYAFKRDGAGKGQGKSSSSSGDSKEKGQSGSGNKPGDQGPGQKGVKSSSAAGKGGNKSGGSSGQKGKSGSDSKSGNSKSSNDTSRSEDRQKQDGQPEKSDQSESKDSQSSDADKQNEEQKEEDKEDSESRSGENRSDERSSSSSSNPISKVASSLGGLATALKWILLAVGILVACFFLFRSGLRFLANFTHWARALLDAINAWWAGLFGSRTRAEEDESEVAEEIERRPQPRPFAYFRNPFDDGTAAQRSPDELARYSFEALEAWARERGEGRKADETPLEFTERLVGEVPALEAPARRLAGLYARVAYARGRLTPAALGPLREFWERLEAVHDQPLSA